MTSVWSSRAAYEWMPWIYQSSITYSYPEVIELWIYHHTITSLYRQCKTRSRQSLFANSTNRAKRFPPREIVNHDYYLMVIISFCGKGVLLKIISCFYRRSDLSQCAVVQWYNIGYKWVPSLEFHVRESASHPDRRAKSSAYMGSHAQCRS